MAANILERNASVQPDSNAADGFEGSPCRQRLTSVTFSRGWGAHRHHATAGGVNRRASDCSHRRPAAGTDAVEVAVLLNLVRPALGVALLAKVVIVGKRLAGASPPHPGLGLQWEY